MMRKVIALIIFVWLLPAAQATIINNGNFTTDDSTNLDWLDMSFSIGLSYNDVDNLLASGGVLDGWRYATSTELTTLVTNYITEIGTFTLDPSCYCYEPGSLAGLAADLGTTASDDMALYTYGLLADIPQPDYHTIASIRTITPLPGPGADDLYVAGYDKSLDTNATGTLASFLVRTSVSVPEPYGLALLCIGLIGLGIFRKKQYHY
jgi:hypothetical protein